jgi:beta-lactamase class D
MEFTMKTLGALLLSTSTLLSCATAQPTSPGPRPLELGGRFDGGADTCVLVLDLETGESWEHGGSTCDTPRAPYSTFKIPHALIGLETGELSGPDHLEVYDGAPVFLKSWARDHTLASALEHSVVWYFQRLARRIGPERMRAHLERLSYGNAQVGPRQDRFWLDGSLTVTARDQLAFVAALEREALPFAPAHQRTLKALWRLPEVGDGFAGKTGSGYDSAREVFTGGWFIGTARGDEGGTVAVVAWRGGDGWSGTRVRDEVAALVER